MACDPCKLRSALIAALARAISSLSLHRRELLNLLALPDAQLLAAVKLDDPRGLCRSLERPLPTKHVPTALCRHDAGYPEALAQLPSAPAVLHATCPTGRLAELLSKPTVREDHERVK